ncbi:YjbQ family protein [Hungatella sp.]|uniref:YjbQ family protein n=1 Tax=Hungatella sp. TaxID=2613924 RepID=UPI003994AF9C
MLKNFKIKTKYNEVYDITEHVKKAVEESGVKEGTCLVYNPHSTAGLAVFSPWDPDGFLDLDEEIRRLVPTRIDFKHQRHPQDAGGPCKIGASRHFREFYRA